MLLRTTKMLFFVLREIGFGVSNMITFFCFSFDIISSNENINLISEICNLVLVRLLGLYVTLNSKFNENAA